MNRRHPEDFGPPHRKFALVGRMTESAGDAMSSVTLTADGRKQTDEVRSGGVINVSERFRLANSVLQAASAELSVRMADERAKCSRS